MSAAIVSNLLPQQFEKYRLEKNAHVNGAFLIGSSVSIKDCDLLKPVHFFWPKALEMSPFTGVMLTTAALAATCNKPDFIMRAAQKKSTVSSLYMACANYMPRYISVVLQQNNPAFWSCAIFPLRISHDCCLAASHQQL